jgi:hypothetical protein
VVIAGGKESRDMVAPQAKEQHKIQMMAEFTRYIDHTKYTNSRQTESILRKQTASEYKTAMRSPL